VREGEGGLEGEFVGFEEGDAGFDFSALLVVLGVG
jgi:hypothetical protein